MTIRYIEDGRYDWRVLYQNQLVGRVHIEHTKYRFTPTCFSNNNEQVFNSEEALFAFISKCNWSSYRGPASAQAKPPHFIPKRPKLTKQRWSVN